ALARAEQGAFGFYEEMGAQGALDALRGAAHASATVPGDPGDATSLDNMRRSFDYIRECNELRRAEGLPELLVSDTLMAIAQSDLNWSDGAVAHSSQFFVGENLSWNYADPFTGWYDNEKADGGGHYQNIVNGDYAGTGFAVCTAGRSGIYSISYGQVFSLASSDYGTLYTVDAYEARFEQYLGDLAGLAEEAAGLESTAAAAEERVRALGEQETALSQRVQEAQAAMDAADEEYARIQGELGA
ncbi:MAG: CAP domain-containing protein, partial [Oscillospiraceae bacterium]|nr:CAP domain-containing protein [Oscillospiraceae bacterium]